MIDPPIQFLTVQEVANLSRLSTDKIKEQINRGRLKARNLGGRAGYRITRGDYDTWAETLIREGL